MNTPLRFNVKPGGIHPSELKGKLQYELDNSRIRSHVGNCSRATARSEICAGIAEYGMIEKIEDIRFECKLSTLLWPLHRDDLRQRSVEHKLVGTMDIANGSITKSCR